MFYFCQRYYMILNYNIYYPYTRIYTLILIFYPCFTKIISIIICFSNISYVNFNVGHDIASYNFTFTTNRGWYKMKTVKYIYYSIWLDRIRYITLEIHTYVYHNICTIKYIYICIQKSIYNPESVLAILYILMINVRCTPILFLSLIKYS